MHHPSSSGLDLDCLRTCFALWPLTKPAVFFPMSMNMISGMGSSRRPLTGRPPDQYSTFFRRLKCTCTAGPVAPCWIMFTPLASTFLRGGEGAQGRDATGDETKEEMIGARA